MSSSIPALLSAAGQPLLRSASAFVAKAARGFHVLRIDGYSWTKTLPAGECITSQQFAVSNRAWHIDYYPNGADGSKDTGDSIALYLRLVQHSYHHNTTPQRVRAEYKFSLLDLTGNQDYEVPAETGFFWTAGGDDGKDQNQIKKNLGCGFASFINKEDMEMRRNVLLKADCLAIRCDVAVPTVEAQPLAASKHGRRSRNNYSSDDDGDSDDDRRRRPLDDKDYIRRCLTAKR